MRHYKTGDRIKCISVPDPGTWFDNNPITIGKLYTVHHESGDAVYIHNDLSQINGYYYFRFIKCNNISKNIRIL